MQFVWGEKSIVYAKSQYRYYSHHSTNYDHSSQYNRCSLRTMHVYMQTEYRSILASILLNSHHHSILVFAPAASKRKRHDTSLEGKRRGGRKKESVEEASQQHLPSDHQHYGGSGGDGALSSASSCSDVHSLHARPSVGLVAPSL